MFSRKRLCRRLQSVFAVPQQAADAQKIFSLMIRRAVADRRLNLGIVGMACLIVLGVVGLVLDWSLAFAIFWVWGLVLATLFIGFFGLKEEKKCQAARAELFEIMEFGHAQFPYWKNIAMKLKAILEAEGLYREGMLPPHVLNGGH